MGQLATGALSDRLGRKWMIAGLTFLSGVVVAARMAEVSNTDL